MKKRLAALAFCLAFTFTLIAVPRARAAVVEAAAASIGAAVLASYMAASDLDFTVDSADTVTSGLESLAEDYLTDTGSTETAESWLSTIAGLVTVPGAGVLQLPASVVRIIGAFTSWLTETFGLTEEGSEAEVVAGTGMFLYNFDELPDIEAVWTDKETYPYATIRFFNNGTDTQHFLDLSVSPFVFNGSYVTIPSTSSGGYVQYGGSINGSIWDSWAHLKGSGSGRPNASSLYSTVWANYDILNSDGSVYLAAFDPVSVGGLSVSRGAGFTNVANDLTEDSNEQLNIYVPSTITTLDDLAATVPDQIVSNTFNVTYELTQEGTGEGSDTDDGTGADDTTVGLLQSILQGVKAIPDAFTNSLTDVFTPSQEAVDSLAAEVDAKLPIIPTLQNFGSDLVYNLEHPESCADGLGLTTVVDLKKGRGSYLGDTTHDILDVSWYLEYKDMVDDIIVGFCWLGFLWNCYGALPRIIHGEGSVYKVASILQTKFDDEGD